MKEALVTPIQSGQAETPPPLIIPTSALIPMGWGDRMDPTRPMQYGLFSDGIYLRKSTLIGTVQTKMGSMTIPSGMVGIPKGEEFFNPAFSLIPWDHFEIALSFLKAMKEKLNCETMVRFFYDFETDRWTSHVPTQTVSVASVDVENSDDDSQVPGSCLVEIHSHPGDSSSFSGIDDAHEQLDRVFLCVAWDKGGRPNFHARVGTGLKQWTKISLAEVVDLENAPDIPVSIWDILTGSPSLPPISYPASWEAKVTKEPESTPTTGIHYHQIRGGYIPAQQHAGVDRPRLVAPSNRVPSGDVPERDTDLVQLDGLWLSRKAAREAQMEKESQEILDWLRERKAAGDLVDIDEQDMNS